MKRRLFAFQLKQTLHFGEARALDRYDRLFVIDTGSKRIRGTDVSIGCFAQCWFDKGVSQWLFKTAVLGTVEFHGAQKKQENLGWHILIKAIQASPDYSPDHCYGIITDCDLGLHTVYNNKEAPYFQDHILPDNITLMYAHDKGGSLSNKAVGICDKQAKKMIKKFEKQELSLEGASEVVSGVCSHFRGWLNSNADVKQMPCFRITHFPRETLDNTAMAA